MNNEELEEIEELDELENAEPINNSIGKQPNPFQRRTMGNSGYRNVPNSLNNRSLEKRNNTSPKKSSNNNRLGVAPKKSLDKDASTKNKLKNKKSPMNFFNRRKNQEEKGNINNTTSNQVDEHDNDGSTPIEELIKIKRVALIVKIVFIGAIAIAVVAFALAAAYVVSWVTGIGLGFTNLGRTDIDETTDYYKEQLAYNKKLNEVTAMYQESCGIFLDRNYIHASLIYGEFIYDNDEDMAEKYRIMTDYADDVAKLMVTNCVVDYEVGGNFYNNLLNSSFLKEYYKEQLKFVDEKNIVDGIFDLAKTSVDFSNLNYGFISGDIKVTMGTCEQPYNKKLLNEGTKYTSTVSFIDYLKGVIYAEVEDHITEDKKEFLKAFTIVATTYVLSRAGYNSGDDEIWVHNGECWQVSCDIHQGCYYDKELTSGYITAFTGPNKEGKYWKSRISPKQNAILEDVFGEAYGTVLLDSSGNYIYADHYDKQSSCPSSNHGCMGQDEAAQDAKNGMKYLDILEKYYNNFDIRNMLEDSYTGDVTYSNGGYKKDVVYYDQTDYNNRFCGTKSTIKGSGCGVTSMAMVLSTFVDGSYTPPVVMEEAYNGKYCGSGISGTSTSFFRYSAQKHGLGYQAVGKRGDKQVVLDALERGDSLVIAHMGPGTFTSGGHYIVLTKVNDKGQVYVLDSNYSRRTGWHDFNTIAKELKSYGSFHIITKR